MAGTEIYIPERGDLVWLTFNPDDGHDQSGRRPALVMSPQHYNQATGLALFCPITSQIKGYPFEVALPTGLRVPVVILADQLRSLDWRARQAVFIGQAPLAALNEVLRKLDVLLKTSKPG